MMMLCLFFFQLSSDIQAFIHSLIARDGMMNDEEVYQHCSDLHHGLFRVYSLHKL